MSDKLKELLRNYMGYLAVAFVSLSYIATSFVIFEGNAKDPAQIVADGVVAFVLGILMNRIFEVQGIANGERDERVAEAVRRHGQSVEGVGAFLDVLEEWCEMKNTDATCRARRKYLSMHAMRYEDYFDADGAPKPFVRHTVHTRGERWRELVRAWHFRHAVRLKLTRLSAGGLMSDAEDSGDPYYMGRSKPEYLAASTKRDLLTKLLTAVTFGYYSVELIRDFDPAYLIWTVFQVGVFLAMGVIKMQQSTLYITDEYRTRMIKKADVLQQFEIYLRREKGENGKRQGEQDAYEDCGGRDRRLRNEQEGQDTEGGEAGEGGGSAG